MKIKQDVRKTIPFEAPRHLFGGHRSKKHLQNLGAEVLQVIGLKGPEQLHTQGLAPAISGPEREI